MTELLSAVGGIIGLIASLAAIWEFVLRPQKARQAILDRLEKQASSGLNWSDQSLSERERIDLIARDGVDASTLQSTTAGSNKYLWRSIKRLYADGKIDIYILEAPMTEGDSTGLLPIFVKGLLPPDLRADRSKAEFIIDQLSSSS